MSFFNWQGIPEDLLCVLDEPSGLMQDDENTSSDEDTDCPSGPDVNDEFESDIIILKDYSFITSGKDSTSMVFTMHRLVQLTALLWLKTYGQEEEWKNCFIKNLHREFPTGAYENWERCRALFPHVRSVLAHRPKSQDSLYNWAALLYKGAWYATESGSISVAEEMAAMSRKQRIKIYGAEDKEALDSTALLAEVYELEADGKRQSSSIIANLAPTLWEQGRWEEAEQLELQAMEMSKIKLGADYPDTLIIIAILALALKSMGSLTFTLWNQGRWEEAKKLQVQVMAISKVKLGADHPDRLKSMGSLALTLWDQGRRKEVEQLELQVMEMSKVKLGADHPDTLTSMGNMASTLWNQGRWKEAEQLELQVMEISKTKLGADHSSTLLSMANLAFTWEATGQHSKAIDLLRACVAKEQRVLGPTHPDTVSDAETLLKWETAHLNLDA
ncbi:hypothetical protein N7493_011940 [Penicillium malachiteum]|uniref:Kinesin light chain n=1 Tax=Penicillium malachiteum TaxID=1324776 RepID=A0AAD6HA37_9EURO|nr:hypothetical protein N7493_011940 [Penicillium malachiteum]